MDDDYGIVASQLGYDALTAPDQNQILSSESPLLKIDKSVTVNITLPDFGKVTLYNHALGYPCFFVVYRIVNGYVMNERLTYLSVDSNNIYLDVPFGFAGAQTFKIVICRNPLTKTVTSPTFRSVNREAAQRDTNYGLIVAKRGKSTDSTDMRDYNFHSNTRNFLIHKVLHGAITTATALIWNNDLTYRPTWYAFASMDGGNEYRLLYGGEQGDPAARQLEDGDVRIRGADGWFGSIFIFKDPIDPGVTTAVTI